MNDNIIPLAAPVSPPDPIELLRKSGYRRTFGDDVADFLWDIRVHPTLALVCAGGGMLAGLLGVIVPAILIAWVTL